MPADMREGCRAGNYVSTDKWRNGSQPTMAAQYEEAHEHEGELARVRQRQTELAGVDPLSTPCWRDRAGARDEAETGRVSARALSAAGPGPEGALSACVCSGACWRGPASLPQAHTRPAAAWPPRSCCAPLTSRSLSAQLL